jgi:hypothetical protein
MKVGYENEQGHFSCKEFCQDGTWLFCERVAWA